jgi:hypothetical protein
MSDFYKKYPNAKEIMNTDRITLRYDYMGAHYESNENRHAQKVIEELGFTVFKFEGCPIADCCFLEVDNINVNLPKFIKLSDHKI